MVLIFVSHSQHDTEIRNFFGNIIGSVKGVNPRFMEFENIKGYPAQFIKDGIKNEEVKAVFVLLGSNVIKNPYTQNWVSFEVGIATALRKPIWVFEQFNANIQFVVPYLDYYMMYTIDDKEHFNYIRYVIESYKFEESVPAILLRLKAEARFQFAFKKVECPECHASYHLVNNVRDFKCPVCCKMISFRI